MSRLKTLAGNKSAAVATLLLVVISVFALRLEGRVWHCSCGRFIPWVGDAWSPHTSQHFLDPYSFTHVLHGFIFFWVIAYLLPQVPFAWSFFLANAVEAAWEIVENTTFAIERYRENTASLGYQGDSVVNSMGDLLTCAIGFLIATRLSLRATLALFAIIEVALLVAIRDSLLLNVVMLFWSFPELKEWQSGA